MGGLVALASEVVKKVLYAYNSNVLNSLSNEVDEKSPNEEQVHIGDYVEIYISINRKYPSWKNM